MTRCARMALLTLALVVTALGASAVWAANSESINLSWHVLSGGGAPSATPSGRVDLNATLGQTVIGGSVASRADVRVQAGYWTRPAGYGLRIYLPVVLCGG